MASALTFINPTIRCFSPADCQKAYDHISLALVERERANRVTDKLQRRLTDRLSTE
jgi:hypothetical protein